MTRINRLSTAKVKSAKPPKGKQRADLLDGLGLHLQVSYGTTGEVNKSWTFRYERHGKRHEMGLGSLDVRSLAQARVKAKTLRTMLADGLDPLTERRRTEQEEIAAAAAATTFQAMAEKYMTLQEPSWERRHAQQWRSTLTRYAFPKIGRLAPAEVTAAMVHNIVEPIWASKRPTAERVLNRVTLVLDFCLTRKFVTENVAKHVLAGLPKRNRIEAKVEHHAAIPYADMPELVQALRAKEARSALVIEFVILTAARVGEAVKTTWEHIDWTAQTWNRPAEIMKMREAHSVPLLPRAMEILRGFYEVRQGEKIFDVSQRAMLEMLQRIRPGITVHGMRSSFRQWATERTGYPDHVAEIALAHKVGGNVERIYKRKAELFDKRRRMMEQWATFCATPAPAEKPSAEVVPLRAG
jgi:integrase